MYFSARHQPTQMSIRHGSSYILWDVSSTRLRHLTPKEVPETGSDALRTWLGWSVTIDDFGLCLLAWASVPNPAV